MTTIASMGRPKEYRKEDVVERALTVFWKSGFEGTSVKDLERATGLNKFGLYAAFGSKKKLFWAALELYTQAYLEPAFRSFEPATNPDAVRQFLNGVVENLTRFGGMGCFLVNSGVEFQSTDPQLSKLIDDAYTILTDKMERHWGSRARAESFTALVLGLMATGRLGKGREALERIVEGSRPLWQDQAS